MKDLKKIALAAGLMGLLANIDQNDIGKDGVYDLSLDFNRREKDREAFLKQSFSTPDTSSQGFTMNKKRRKARAKSKAARKARRRHK